MKVNELKKGKAFELKPGRRYIIVLDPRFHDIETASQLAKGMDRIGCKALVAMLEGDSYQIIEEK